MRYSQIYDCKISRIFAAKNENNLISKVRQTITFVIFFYMDLINKRQKFGHL